MTGGTTIREVDIRTWPERSDVVVIDVKSAIVLAQFPYLDPEPGKVADLSAEFQERAARAIEQVELHQDVLQGHYGVGEDIVVRLKPTLKVRAIVNSALESHGITLEETKVKNLENLMDKLETMPVTELFGLVCDWFDVVERRYPSGSAAREEMEWVSRSEPSRSVQFHYLAHGLEDRKEATEDQTLAAQEFFRFLIDVQIEEFNLGHILRWVYYHRTEFDNIPRFELTALNDFPENAS